jgi:hypothetical protein
MNCREDIQNIGWKDSLENGNLEYQETNARIKLKLFSGK